MTICEYEAPDLATGWGFMKQAKIYVITVYDKQNVLIIGKSKHNSLPQILPLNVVLYHISPK